VARAAVEIAEVPEVLSFFEMAFDQTLVTPVVQRLPDTYRLFVGKRRFLCFFIRQPPQADVLACTLRR